MASCEDVHNLKKLFETIDSNNNGMLSRSEIEEAYRLYGQQLSDDELN